MAGNINIFLAINKSNELVYNIPINTVAVIILYCDRRGNYEKVFADSADSAYCRAAGSG